MAPMKVYGCHMDNWPPWQFIPGHHIHYSRESVAEIQVTCSCKKRDYKSGTLAALFNVPASMSQ
jgi:hypothetical protein